MSESQGDQSVATGAHDVAPANDETLASPQPSPAEPLPSAGTLLREAREAAGVDLATLAQALKVSVKKIEALESDAYERLPDPVFTRGLASSVCRALKIDTKPILDRMPSSPTVRLAQEEGGLNTPFQTPGDVAKTPFMDQLSRPMILAALAILLGAVVLVFFPSAERRSEISTIVGNTPANAPSADTSEVPNAAVAGQATAGASDRVEVVPPAPISVAATPTVAASKQESATPTSEARSTSVAASVIAAASPTPPPTPAPNAVTVTPRLAAVSAPASAVASTAPSSASSAATAVDAGAASDTPRKKLPGTGVVVFKTTGSSWINVTDAQGSVLLSRQVEPDEPVGVSGKMPLSISIGRADLTTVTVRGQPYDLVPVTRQGVARFELK